MDQMQWMGRLPELATAIGSKFRVFEVAIGIEIAIGRQKHAEGRYSRIRFDPYPK